MAASEFGLGDDMGRYAIIKNGVVTGIAVSNADFAASQGWVAAPDTVQEGDGYDDGQFTPQEPAVAEPDPVKSISRFQARVALRNAGMLTQVENVVAASDELTQMAWADTVQWNRDSPTINALATQIGLTQPQIDTLFEAASKIEV